MGDCLSYVDCGGERYHFFVNITMIDSNISKKYMIYLSIGLNLLAGVKSRESNLRPISTLPLEHY